MQVAPSGELELVSTHEQILGGPRGQTYLGCRFPAAPSYAREISRLARRVGEHLATRAVMTFVSRAGEEKYYVATDCLEAPQLRALGDVGLLALAGGRDLRFNAMMRTGGVFHMLSSVDELGRVGFTAIGNTRDEAGALYQHVRTTVLARAQAVVDSRRSTRQSSRSQLSSAALTVSGASWLTQ
jgi:hypothetical protein